MVARLCEEMTNESFVRHGARAGPAHGMVLVITHEKHDFARYDCVG